MNQSAASQPSRKKAVFSLLTLLALTCVIVLIFRDHWAEITAALTQLNLWQVLVVLALGISDDFSLRIRRCDGAEEAVQAGEVHIRPVQPL